VGRTPSGWQSAVQNAVRDMRELAQLLDLPVDEFPVTPDFPLLVPRGFVARIRKGDPRDPLLLQVLPQRAELESVLGYGPDPLGERQIASGGVLRKYAGRALLIATGACPVHCRYCFRRAFPYDQQTASRGDWSAAIAALAGEQDVTEVILSGGDPLSLSNRRLGELVAQLEALPIARLRIHTRFPIVVPERIDVGLIEILAGTRLDTVVVVHCNHPRELDATTSGALRQLRSVATQVLNQSVLLRGVNDDADTLAELSEALFRCGVLPYYLHLLDRVAGAAHFEVGEHEAAALMSALRARLPGYLVPRLVREIPGELSKTLVA
jgi:EF-P beta-lysylation protein EpmB